MPERGQGAVPPSLELHRLPQCERGGREERRRILGGAGIGGFDPYQLAGLIWNHAPKMWGAMASEGVPCPRSTSSAGRRLVRLFLRCPATSRRPATPARKAAILPSGAAGSGHGSIAPVRARVSGRWPNGTRRGPNRLPRGCGTIPAIWRARSTRRKSLIRCSPRRN